MWEGTRELENYLLAAADSAVPLSAANAVWLGLWKSPGPPTLIAMFDCPEHSSTEPKETLTLWPADPAATRSVRL
eukprot:COSAG04_NODE_691_length_11104_cov_6.949841_1_plen_75_part_00